jgi:hypothetical protein
MEKPRIEWPLCMEAQGRKGAWRLWRGNYPLTAAFSSLSRLRHRWRGKWRSYEAC